MRWLRWPFLGLSFLCVILPLIWTVFASLRVQPNNTVSPPTWTWPPSLESYLEIRSEQTFFWQELATSTLLSLLVTFFTLIISLLAAYILARTRLRWRRLTVQGCLILASLPAISFVFPLSDVLRFLHLHDTFIGLILAETAAFAPLATFVLYGYIGQLPQELEEAAYLDGAGLIRVLTGVVLPVLSSGIVAASVIVFVLSWNQFFLPLVLTGIQVRVIPVMMRDFFSLERDFDWRVASAVLIVSLTPVSVFVALAHRRLERFGLVALADGE